MRQSQTFAYAEKMTKKLETINKLKDDFLAVTSHELKTPLNGIIGLTEGCLSNKQETLSEEISEDLQLINHSARRLSNLVEDILVFKIET